MSVQARGKNQRKKTEGLREREFQCRVSLWHTFDDFAITEHTSIDELINEAMAEYARTRGYDVDAVEEHAPPAAHAPRRGVHPEAITEAVEAVDDEDDDPSQNYDRDARDEDDSEREELDPELEDSAPDLRPPRTQRWAPPRQETSRPSTPPNVVRRGSNRPHADERASVPPPVSRPINSRPGPILPRTRPPPLPPPSPSRAPPPMPTNPPVAAAAGRHLTLAYLGDSFDVESDRFIIGRSKSGADLRIDDANVSRQHAAVERVGSIWYVVDLGSTNGVYVGDAKVTRRALSDADVITITSHRIDVVIR